MFVSFMIKNVIALRMRRKKNEKYGENLHAEDIG